MNTGSHPEVPEDVPEADALEQQTPVQPDGSGDLGLVDGLPEDAAEADVLEYPCLKRQPGRPRGRFLSAGLVTAPVPPASKAVQLKARHRPA